MMRRFSIAALAILLGFLLLGVALAEDTPTPTPTYTATPTATNTWPPTPIPTPGYLVEWGYDTDYQVLDKQRYVHAQKISDGYSHSLALKTDGSLVGWGDNANGQTTCPAGTNYVAVAAGQYHSLALKTDGDRKSVV